MIIRFEWNIYPIATSKNAGFMGILHGHVSQYVHGISINRLWSSNMAIAFFFVRSSNGIPNSMRGFPANHVWFPEGTPVMSINIQ